MKQLFRIADWPFLLKLGSAPAIAMVLMFVLLVTGNSGIETQSASMAKIVGSSVEGSGLLSEAQQGVQSINGGLYRVLALQAAKTQGLASDAELKRLGGRIDEVVAKLTQFRDRYATDDQKPEIEKLIGETDRSAQDMLNAAGDLSQQSDTLRREVDGFLANIRAA